jgi:hypothetical protein
MNRFDHQWQKLITAARQAPADLGTAAPYGFATRVAAQAYTLPAAPWLSLERFALRGLFVAAICGLTAAAFNYSVFSTELAEITASGTTDVVADILDVS